MSKRVLLLFCAACLVIAAQAQPPAGGKWNVTDAKGRKQGSWSKTWPNGKTRYMGQFKDDRPVGIFHHFDEEDRLTTFMDHGDGSGPTRAVHYHSNGRELAKGNYLGQVKDSTWKYFSDDGKLRKVERFASGKLEGEQVSYYPDGSIAESETRKAGVSEGPNKSWFANGKLKSEVSYQAGEPEGKMTFYFPSGKKEIEGAMVNGDRDGTWYYFNEDGTVQLQVLYAKGQLLKERKENGSFKEYYDDEQLKSETVYKKGKREGPFSEFYDNGRWEMKMMEADPVMGTPGDVERVLRGQTKKKEGTYVNDLLEGEVKEYDEKGRVIRTTRYAAGVEQAK